MNTKIATFQIIIFCKSYKKKPQRIVLLPREIGINSNLKRDHMTVQNLSHDIYTLSHDYLYWVI